MFSEENTLEDADRSRMQIVKQELEHIWLMEEIKAKQRSRDRNVKEGDRNTSYFQTIANQRKRKKRIEVLQGQEGEVTEIAEMIKIATHFYKNLFAFEDKLDIHLDSSFWKEDDKVTAEENGNLDAPLSEEEIKQSIFYSYADGAPGPDGFPFLFYQKF